MIALLIIDASTSVPAIAFRMDEPERGLDGASLLTSHAIIERGGFGTYLEEHRGYVALVRADGSSWRSEVDPFKWGDLTMTAAHLWLVDHFDEHPAGGSLDVEHLRLALADGRPLPASVAS